MGKTIQLISLIQSRPRPAAAGPSSPLAVLPMGAAVKATLVICPLVAVIQWRDEIAKARRREGQQQNETGRSLLTTTKNVAEKGHPRVYIYHGAKRRLDSAALQAADIVITTYSVIEAVRHLTFIPRQFMGHLG